MVEHIRKGIKELREQGADDGVLRIIEQATDTLENASRERRSIPTVEDTKKYQRTQQELITFFQQVAPSDPLQVYEHGVPMQQFASQLNMIAQNWEDDIPIDYLILPSNTASFDVARKFPPEERVRLIEEGIKIHPDLRNIYNRYLHVCRRNGKSNLGLIRQITKKEARSLSQFSSDSAFNFVSTAFKKALNTP